MKPKIITSDLSFNSSFNRVSDSCALFYLLFVSICDDTGGYVYDIEDISIRTGKRWHKGHIRAFVKSLSTRGLLNVHSDSSRLVVVNWHWHQQHEEVSEQLVADAPVTPKKARNQKAAPSEESLEKARLLWDAYKESYFNRYGTDPVRNAKVNAQLKQLTERLGADAPEVAKFYLNHSDLFYVKSLHALGPLVMNCESLHTQWRRGQPLTTQQAKQIGKVDEHKDQMERLRKIIHERYPK